jgi:hypothetical protein
VLAIAGLSLAGVVILGLILPWNPWMVGHWRRPSSAAAPAGWIDSSSAKTFFREELAAFEPSASEERFLVVARRKEISILERHVETQNETLARKQAAELHQWNQWVAAILGERRFQDFVRSRTPGYALVYRIVKSRGLDPTVLQQFVKIREETLAKLGTNSLTRSERLGLEQDLRNRLLDLLGPDGLAELEPYWTTIFLLPM